MCTTPPVEDVLKSSQLFQARLKANDVAQEHLKQIITVSSATLVLTVTFVKDIVGTNATAVVYPWLMWGSWILLAISILSAIVTIALLVNNLDIADETVNTGKKFPKAFAASALPAVRFFVSASILLFALGILGLAVFAAFNFSVRFASDPNSRRFLSEVAAIEAAKSGVSSGKSFMYTKSIQLAGNAPKLPNSLLVYQIDLAVKNASGNLEIEHHLVDAFSGATALGP